MRKQTLFFVAPLIFLISVTAEFAWGQDVILEGTTGSGVYTSQANIIAQNNFTINNGEQAYLIAHDSTILRPGSSVKAGGVLISFPSDRDLLPDDWEMEHFSNLDEEPEGDNDEDELPNINEYSNNTDPNDWDSDDDGMPDGWEIANNLNPLDAMDAGIHSDSDNLTNLEEYQNDTNPHDEDSDDDGMPDCWEVQYDLNPRSEDDEDGAEGDPDYDNSLNINEYLNGTNPNNPDTDGDGMLDGWEEQFEELDPLVMDGESDYDGDDFSNYFESVLQTDPTDPTKPGTGNFYEYDELGRIKRIIRKQ